MKTQFLCLTSFLFGGRHSVCLLSAIAGLSFSPSRPALAEVNFLASADEADFADDHLFGDGQTDGQPSPNLGSYELKEVPSDGIEQFMPIARGDRGLPQSIQGIWWMDGNPSGDILVSLANLNFDRVSRTVKLPVYGAKNYTYLKNVFGRQAFAGALRGQLSYEVKFNEAADRAILTTCINVGGHEFRIPKWITRFTMGLQEDGHWIRYSWLFGIRVANYDLRRVVNVDGSRTPAYENYLKYAGPTSLLPVFKS